LKPVKTVIAIAGMPGSGKAVASGVARERSIPVFVCGDVVREEASSRKLPPSPENLGSLMLKMREEEGPDVMVRRLLPRIGMASSGHIVVEGLRSLDEYESLQKRFKTRLLAIHAPPEQRFQRLLRRGRSDDPKNATDFSRRDHRELNLGVGSVIALAEHLLVNDSTIESFKLKLKRLYEEILS